MAMEKLDERSRSILKRRWMTDDKATLHELADEYGIVMGTSHEEPMMGIFVRKNSRAVQRNGASRQANGLLFLDASATPVEKIMQISPPTNPIIPTKAAEIHGSILPYCRMTVSTHGRHTG